jgi:hypothetical protein
VSPVGFLWCRQYRHGKIELMTYYQASTFSEELICDDCGETRWETHPKYGSNVESRLEEADRTGVRWSWVPVYGGKNKCSLCNGSAK